MNRVKLSLRLPQHQVNFLKRYGQQPTEAIEKALDRLEELEENENSEQDQKAQGCLAFLKEKERIKTEALKERLRERQKQRPTRAARVDWGEGYAGDSDSKYEDGWGENF